MHQVLGFGFQQCSLRLRKPKLVEREIPAETMVSFCSYLEKLTVAERSARFDTPIPQELKHQAANKSGSNDLLTQMQKESLASNLIRIKQFGTYLPVAGCCGVAASRATYV